MSAITHAAYCNLHVDDDGEGLCVWRTSPLPGFEVDVYFDPDSQEYRADTTGRGELSFTPGELRKIADELLAAAKVVEGLQAAKS